MVDIVRETDILGFEKYPEEVELMLNQVDWADRLNKQRVGVVLTFSRNEQRDKQYIRYNVDEMSDGTSIFLLRPAWLNKGYDFKVCVDDWDDSAHPTPSHQEIYSDLYWKRKHDDPDSFDVLCEAVISIHRGESPESVLEEYDESLDFSVGRTPEALLKPLPWLFIEQDIRYWNYSGRNMTIEVVEQLYEGDSFSDIDLKLQELDEINGTELAISNSDWF